MLRQWRTIVAPQEKVGKAWRSEGTLGVKEATAIQKAFSTTWFPILFAIMKRHLDDGMSLEDAANEVQTLKGANGWDFAASLPKPDAESKARYKAALLQLTSSDAGSTSMPPVPTSPPSASADLPSPTAPDSVALT